MRPMITPCQGSTKPDAGVMVPRPAMAPVIKPSTDGFLRVHHSRNIQVSAPAEAARWVAVMAKAARELAPSAEPPLNPSQPTHNRPVPITASDRSYGAKLSEPYPYRLPTTSAATKPATPALRWTTVPPAKSSAPALARKPPPQTQCAIGTYTKMSQLAQNHKKAEKRMRSAIEPAIRATVMIANVI